MTPEALSCQCAGIPQISHLQRNMVLNCRWKKRFKWRRPPPFNASRSVSLFPTSSASLFFPFRGLLKHTHARIRTFAGKKNPKQE